MNGKWFFDTLDKQFDVNLIGHGFISTKSVKILYYRPLGDEKKIKGGTLEREIKMREKSEGHETANKRFREYKRVYSILNKSPIA